jgi:polar amino acid transport system substrate-binding protein
VSGKIVALLERRKGTGRRKVRLLRGVLAAFISLLLVGAASADRLGDIKARGALIVGVSTAIPPFTFQRGSEIVGYDVDLVRGIARRIGVKLELLPVGEADRIKAVQAGKIDLIASTFTRTPGRERDVAFSLDIFNSPQVMIVDKASGLTSVKQMNGGTFGVLTGRTSDQNIREVIPDAKFVYLDGYASAFAGLRNKSFIAFVADNLVLRTNLVREKDIDRFHFIADFSKPRNAGFGMPKNEPALKEAVDRALLAMETSGEAVEIYNVWFGPKSAVPIERALRIGASP